MCILTIPDLYCHVLTAQCTFFAAPGQASVPLFMATSRNRQASVTLPGFTSVITNGGLQKYDKEFTLAFICCCANAYFTQPDFAKP